MGKSLFSKIALESELEIEKLLDKEQEAKGSNEYDLLYNAIQDDYNVEENKEADNETDSKDTETVNSTSDEEVETPDGQTEEEAVATEELKNLQYYNVATEEFSESSGGVLNTLGSGLKYLWTLGVQWTPTIARNVYKGVLYTFLKLLSVSVKSYKLLDSYLTRRINSFENIKKQIDSLSKALELIKDPKSELDGKYTNVKVINSLKINGSTDLKLNMGVLKGFVTSVIQDLDKSIKDDLGSVKHLMANYGSRTFSVPSSFLTIKPESFNVASKVVEGFEPSSDLLSSYAYKYELPSDVIFIAHLPNPEITDPEAFLSAYSHSKMFLGLDTNGFRDVESIDYMTADKLKGLLSELNSICDICIKHQVLYENMKAGKGLMRFNLKHYFLSLANASHKVSYKDSLINYIYLKTTFVDKVYLTTAIDIHDYSARVLTNALSYIEENIKKLS